MGVLWLRAGKVGRPHGLDGSFHVSRARAGLLELGQELVVAGRSTRVQARKGSGRDPLIMLEGHSGRDAAERLRGEELLVERSKAPDLGPNEWYAEELVGCEVLDETGTVGKVAGLLELPSCEALEVALPKGGELLIPMVKDAIGKVDIEAGQIEVSSGFLADWKAGQS